MGITSDTLNNLYNQGILDYAPYELCSGVNVSALNQGSNPYMQMAMQGGLYQNYGSGTDSFTSNSGLTSPGSMNYGSISGNNTVQSNGFLDGSQGYGAQSQGGMNGFGLQGIGTNSQGGMNAFGLQGIGSQSQGGMNAFGNQNYGVNAQGGMNAAGALNGNIISNNSPAGFNAFGGGFGKIGQTVSQTPSMIKGLIAGGVILGTTILCLKKGKKPPVKKQGFFSKLHLGKKK